MTKTRLSAPLKRLMEETGLKASQLAELVGVQRSNISNYLHDSSNASVPVLLHFAELARSQELREVLYGLAGKSPDFGRNSFSLKLEGFRQAVPRWEIADARQTYSPGKVIKPDLQESGTEVIPVPCLPFSSISGASDPMESLAAKSVFSINFEKDRLSKVDPLGIWLCTRMPATDDSMVNTIFPDELLLVNKRFSLKSRSIAGKIFLVSIRGKCTARRLILEKDSALLIADNHRYPSHFINDLNALKKLLAGHVIWKGGEVK